MDVILKQDVENLGFEFEIVSVKPGYARNFLIPQGKAIIATPKEREALAILMEARKADEEKLIAEAKEKSAKLEGLEIKIETKVGSGTKLFGSVNNADLAEALVKAGVNIERKNIKIPGNTIKRMGMNTAKIRFHREVEVDFEFEVIADQESIKRAEEAAKAKAEVARMDAERLAAANKVEESSFKYDNPLYANDPKKNVVEEVTEVVETTASETESTPTEEA
ncbi:MAG TPA: 50S ribosomal protein L9 [Moheibacter sp.]|nr:50S ribosomal protein L9 [Moheibacter sp.]